MACKPPLILNTKKKQFLTIEKNCIQTMNKKNEKNERLHL